jgi:two-component system, OmpR family, response regulator MprA
MIDSARILIIEDEERIRETMRMALETEGYTVETEADGPKGLHRLQEDRWDLVLLDQCMPGMEGTEVLRRMREGGWRVPVVVVTAYGTVDLAGKVLGTGASGFLLKPINPQQLRQVVADVLASHREQRSDGA